RTGRRCRRHSCIGPVCSLEGGTGAGGQVAGDVGGEVVVGAAVAAVAGALRVADAEGEVLADLAEGVAGVDVAVQDLDGGHFVSRFSLSSDSYNVSPLLYLWQEVATTF